MREKQVLKISPNTLIVLVLSFFVWNVQAQENLVLNGDFENTRKLNPNKKWEEQKDFDPSEISQYIDGPESRKAISMYWNYVEYAKSSANFQMFNAIYSENKKLPNQGRIFSRINVMGLDYSENEAVVTNIVGKLKAPLEKGKSYKVSLFLKPLNGNHFTKSICVAFIDRKIPYSIGIDKSSYEPHFKHGLSPDWCLPEFSKDTTSYTQYEFTYTAKGGETYIYIGNILYEAAEYWDAENWEKNFEATAQFGYRPKTGKFQCEYAIDDVSVTAFSEK